MAPTVAIWWLSTTIMSTTFTTVTTMLRTKDTTTSTTLLYTEHANTWQTPIPLIHMTIR